MSAILADRSQSGHELLGYTCFSEPMDPLLLKRVDAKLWPVAAMVARAGSRLGRFRREDARPLVLRPGGMGDLILLCIAAEEIGCDPRRFFWAIERRSRAWARHLGLDHVCYDGALFRSHIGIASKFQIVVNSEQFFGLSQATALLAKATHGRLTCFDTNRGSRLSDRCVVYEPDRTHESTCFARLLATALGLPGPEDGLSFTRERTCAPGGKPIVGISGLQSPSRAFTEEQWAEFIRACFGRDQFLLASSPIDHPFARRVHAQFSGQSELFEGEFELLCDRIRSATRVLTVDGGFMHIASYYGVPVTGVFTSGRERKWAALAPGSRLVRRTDLSCQPCTWYGQTPTCPNRLACKELQFSRHVMEIER